MIQEETSAQPYYNRGRAGSPRIEPGEVEGLVPDPPRAPWALANDEWSPQTGLTLQPGWELSPPAVRIVVLASRATRVP
jgi:hypothetical protein